MMDNTYSCQSSQFDIISAIDQYTQKSNITWNWCHVKGHQDDFYCPLDRWSTLNVEIDKLAKLQRASDATDDLPIQHKIRKEMWCLYT
eukprot:933383-Ditylum_brightwellii.AAC.1